MIGVAFAVVDDPAAVDTAWRLRTVRCGRHSQPSEVRRPWVPEPACALPNTRHTAILPSVIVVYGGAQVDAQDRSQPRFPEANVDAVADSVRARLGALRRGS